MEAIIPTDISSLNVFEKWWLDVLVSWPYSPALLFTALTMSVFVSVVGSFNIFLYFCYTRNLWPQYRINPLDKFPDKALIKECLNMLLVKYLTRPFALYFGFIYLFEPRGLTMSPPFPSITTILLHLVFFVIVNDTLFYWAHRLLHHRLIYARIHKFHHRFNITIGIAAEFAHPVEDLLANTVPTMLGAYLLRSHILTLWIWLAIRMLETIDAHSGYHFPWSPFYWFPSWQGGADRHDFHHSHNVGSFGSFISFWDWLMGTDKPFKKWYAEQQKVRAKANANS